MKTHLLYLAATIAMVIVTSSVSSAQPVVDDDGRVIIDEQGRPTILDITYLKKATNPFPLPDARWQSLLRKNERIIERYRGQELAGLPGKKREELLIALARRTVLVYVPAFYREHGEPVIEEKVFPHDEKRYTTRDGMKYHEVLFFYDLSKELFERPYVTKVTIMDEDKRILSLEYPDLNGFLIGFESANQEKESRKRYLTDRSLCRPYCAVPDNGRLKEVLKGFKTFQSDLKYYRELSGRSK